MSCGRRNSICASQASRWVGIKAKSQFRASSPNTASSAASRNSAIEAPYQNREQDVVLKELAGALFTPEKLETLSRRSQEKRLGKCPEPGQVIMPTMGKQFHLTLDSLDVGQILDGLQSRQESWANTAIYLRDGYFPDDAFVCEECSHADEAQKIANHYQRIIDAVERQVAAQGSW